MICFISGFQYTIKNAELNMDPGEKSYQVLVLLGEKTLSRSDLVP